MSSLMTHLLELLASSPVDQRRARVIYYQYSQFSTLICQNSSAVVPSKLLLKLKLFRKSVSRP